MSRPSLKKRPLAGSATARVWEIGDDLFRRKGSLPSGREVADIYVAEGGNQGTAFTQYSHWKKAHLNHFQRDRADRPVPGDERAGAGPVSARLSIGSDGRVVVPVELRRAMQLDAAGTVTAQVVDGELRMISPRVAVAQARALVRAFDTGEGSPVEELIRERRAAAERE